MQTINGFLTYHINTSKTYTNTHYSNPGADCNYGPTWKQNSRAQRKNFLFRGRLEMFLIKVFWGHLGKFQGQYTVQVAPQTAPYGLLLQTE